MHIHKLLLEFRLSVNRTMDMSAFFRAGAMAAWKRVEIWTIFPRQQEDTVKSGRRFKWGDTVWTVEDLWLCWSHMGYFVRVYVCCIIFYHWEISQRRGAETDNRITVGHFYLLSSHLYFSVIGRRVRDPSISYCNPGPVFRGRVLLPVALAL